MGEIHELIIQQGREAAIAQADGKSGRAIAEAAAKILQEESARLGVTYAGFCLSALPHKRLPDDQGWVRESRCLTMAVDPGRFERDGTTFRIGVPYGSRARLILLYLQSEAVRTHSPEVSLGRSMESWLDRMGIPAGGKSRKDVKEQADRISACHLSFFWRDASGQKGFSKSGFVTSGINFKSYAPSEQGELWTDTVTLTPEFYKALKDHPVPVLEAAIRELGNRSMSLDIYVWLAYRLHSLSGSTPISWIAIKEQFGAGFDALRTFKVSFKEALALALAVYPDAKVDILAEGLVLHPSRPPVEKSKVLSFAGSTKLLR